MFYIIDPASWDRAEYYRHYMDNARCTYSMTVDIDITRLYAAAKQRGLHTYPLLLYISARAVNAIQNLRFGRDSQGQVGYYDVTHPAYTVFHEDTKLFSTLYTPYSPHFPSFYAAVCADIQEYSGKGGLSPQGELPENIHNFSAIPWASFTAMNLNLYTDGDYLAPIITCGRFREVNGQLMLPLAIQLHHAVADGWHAAEYFRLVQEAAYTVSEWIDG